MAEVNRDGGTRQLDIPADFRNAAELLKGLIEERSFRKEMLEDAAIIAAIQLLTKVITDGDADERLGAVSIFGKAGEVSKPIAAVVHPALRMALSLPLPSIGRWGTADDRYYLAKGISTSNSEWIKDYAAVELAHAESKEKRSRFVWADIAINRAENLAHALRTISRAFSVERKSFKNPVENQYRKLTRLSVTLNETLSIADVPTGDGFGKAFFEIVLLAGGTTGAESIRLRDEAALSVLDLSIQVLRLRFDVLFDADFYRAVGAVRGWWRPGKPSDEVELRSDRIARLAIAGLHILARQGVTDQVLRQSLTSALGIDRINEIGQVVASKDPSLAPSISAWLATGRTLVEAKNNEAVRELSDQDFDELLAKLLIALDGQDGGPQALEAVADSMEILEPAYASTVRTGANRSRIIAQWGQALGARRRLSLFGERGNIITFDPALHEAIGELRRSSSVRVRTPGVKKQLEDRPATIISKAQVEKP